MIENTEYGPRLSLDLNIESCRAGLVCFANTSEPSEQYHHGSGLMLSLQILPLSVVNINPPPGPKPD